MGDASFSELPLVGEQADGRFDPEGRLALFINNLRNEAIADRNAHVDLHPICENLYLYGTEKPGQDHVFPKIQGMIDNFYSIATNTPPTATVKAMTHMDGGPLVVTTGGKPITFDLTMLVDFVQRQLDYTLDKARAVAFFNANVKNGLIYGWQNNLVEWDDALDLPRFRVIPALQWYMPPVEDEIANMPYAGLDWPIDAQDAKRWFPALKNTIDEWAQRSITPQPGATNYSQLYYNFPIARPMVNLGVWWIRNREMRMTDQEAISAGLVESRPMLHEMNETPGQEMAEHAGGEMPDELVHVETGQVIHEAHPLWPLKTVTSISVQINGQIVLDEECRDWDIPVAANYNVRIPNQPFGQSECIRVRTIQKDLNTVHGSQVAQTIWYQGPTVVADERLKEMLPPGAVRNLGMKPGKTYYYDSQGGTVKAADLFEVIPPPQMSPAIPQTKQNLEAVFDTAAGNPGNILQGNSPTANASGILAQTLMATSTQVASAKFKYLEEFWWRVCMLVMHNIRERRTAEAMFNIDRTYPVEVIEQVILPLWKEVELSIVSTVGGNQAKAARDAAVRNDFQLGLLDAETACDMLDYDFDQIQQRRAGAMVAPAAAGSMPGQTPEQPTNPDDSRVPVADVGQVAPPVPAPAESAGM